MADTSGEAEIRRIIEAWAKAVRDLDMNGILVNHTEDVVMFDVPPPVQWKGSEAYRQTWDLFFTYSMGVEGFSLRELEVTAGDTVAFARALQHRSSHCRP